MSYYPEDANHAFQVLEEAITIPGGPTRQRVLDNWLETIHTPKGSAEQNLCAYIGILSLRPEQPVDLDHLRYLIHEADQAWASSAYTHLGCHAKAKKEQAGRAGEARAANSNAAERRRAAIMDIYLEHYASKFGGRANAPSASEAIHDNWSIVTVGTELEDTDPLRPRTIADIIRKSPRYNNN